MRASSSNNIHSNGDDWEHGGWIYKQGSLVRNWKKRFMVLRGKRLAYYDTASITSTTKEKGSFQVITVELSTDIQNGLLVHGVGGRVLKLYTDSAQATSEWYNAIHAAMNSTPAPAPTPVPQNDSQLKSKDLMVTDPVIRANGSLLDNGLRLDGTRLSVLSNLSSGNNQPHALRFSYMSNQNGHASIDVDSEIELMDQLELNKDIEESQLLHSGWLLKQGSRVKSWKRRYFTLRGRILSYFDSQDVGSSCKGHGKVMGAEVNPLRINSLNIRFESGRILCVASESPNDVDTWLNRLNAVANAQKMARTTELKANQFRATMPSLRESMATTRTSMTSMYTAPSQPVPQQLQTTQSKQQMTMRHSIASMPSSTSSEFDVDSRLARFQSQTSSSNNYSSDQIEDLVDDDDEYGSDDSEGDWL